MPAKKKATPKKTVIEEVQAPDIDIERIHNIVRAELAVIKAEEEKKAREEEEKPTYHYITELFGNIKNIWSDKNAPKEVENWYSEWYMYNETKKYNKYLTKYLTRSIIISTLLWISLTLLFQSL